MEILFCGSGWVDIVPVLRARLDPADTLRLWDRTRPLDAEVATVEVILPSNGHVDARVIAAAPALRLIQQPAAGYEGIELAAARARGIPVCNAPGANPVAVAEAALLLMLSLARRVPEARAGFAQARIGGPVGIQLAGRTLGIIGRGRTGDALAVRAQALGMDVIAIGSRATAAERAAFWPACDVISVHCPLTDATRGLIGAGALAAMRPGAFLVNAARGGILDRGAIEAALASGRLGGLGLDVFWEEPWDPADPLWAHPRVVTLPHIAGSTQEAFAAIGAIVVENLARLRRGAALLHRVD